MDTKLGEREAVAIVATFDTANPDYRAAVDTAFGRRGTRDALVVTLARQGEWDKALDVFHGLKSDDPETNVNISTVYAIAHAAAGSKAIAQAIARLYPDNRMLNMLNQLIERNMPIEKWLGRMAELDLDVCFAFAK